MCYLCTDLEKLNNNPQNQSNGRISCVIVVDIVLDIVCGSQVGIRIVRLIRDMEIVVDIV